MSRDLRHRVAIQHNVPTRTKGVRADNWLTLETVYAKIRTLGGMEVVRADQKEGLLTHEVETRYRANFGGILQDTTGEPLQATDGTYIELSGTYSEMLPRYRLSYAGRTFSIEGVVHPYPGNDRTVLRVREVVS